MALWNFSFILLVILPLLTGGVWIQQPHLRLEYTEAGPAAVVLTLLLWWLSHRGMLHPEKSRPIQIARALWARWAKGLAEKPLRTLGPAWLIAALLAFSTSYARHNSLGSGLADLGIFTNGISNVARLGFPSSSIKGGASLLTDHQDFLLYPLGWIFPLWPSPVFLLLLQALAFSTGGIALFLLGRQRLGPAHAAVPLLPFVFWMSGPLRNALRFDVLPEIVMLPLFLFAAYFLQKRSWVGALFLAAALATKESAGPVACGIGLAWLLGAGPAATRAFTRKLGVAVMALGAGLFYFDSHIVPGLFGVSYAYSDLYAPFGSTPIALAAAPFTHPLLFLGRLFDTARLKFLLGTFLPVGFLPLFAPAALVAALPGFLMLFLTEGDHRISLGFHYAVEPMTGLLFALPVALSGIRSRLLFPGLALAALVSYGRSEPFYWRAYETAPHQTWVRDEVLPFVRPDAGVAASYAFVPHLSNREWVDQIYNLMDERLRRADCVLIDASVNNTPMSISDILAMRMNLEKLRGYSTELTCGALTVYRAPSVGACLTRIPACPEKP
jgi:uncharacterized membrane protein